MTDVRTIVVNALDSCTPLLEDSAKKSAVLAGQNLNLETDGLDSLTRYEILMKIEDDLDMDLDDDELQSQTTLNELVAFLEAKTGAGVLEPSA